MKQFHYFPKQGLLPTEDLEREDIERLSRLTKTNIVRDIRKITKEDLGKYSMRSEENIGGINYTTIEGEVGEQ